MWYSDLIQSVDLILQSNALYTSGGCDEYCAVVGGASEHMP
jgi:hypothetical protein